MSAGTVHVYILDVDGRPIASQHVATASKVEELTALLETTIDQLEIPAGKTIVPPTCQSVAPKADDGAIMLHLVVRNLGKDGSPVRPALGSTRNGSWGAYPVEDWITLTRPEWSRLVPKTPIAIGASWQLDNEVGAKLLRRFYPSTENNAADKNRIDVQELKATMVSAHRARIDGKLRMKHTFYRKDDDLFVDAALLGFLDFDDAGRIVDLKLITTEASFGRVAFGVSLHLAK